ncbi:hypothetical protein JCM21900_001422 [Sporobolomyces salmonicolor]
MHRPLRTAFGPLRSCCRCSRPPPARPPPGARYYAAAARSSTLPPQDKLVLAAHKLLNDARAGAEAGSIEAAKKDRELETLKSALQDVQDGQELIQTLRELAETEPDPDLRELARSDLPQAESSLSSLRSHLLSTLLPPSSTSSLSALLELKSGVGGSESALFAGSLVRMYMRLAARKGWKASLVEATAIQGVGAGEAYKEAILEIEGEGAFGVLRREAGVHRVQRVPATESQGRVHTSTVAIIVLPSESAAQPIDDSDLFDPKDVKVETMRSRGAGGQHVNRTESAIRLTHLPTGISVSMQDSRSQHENRAKAYKILRGRLMDRKLQAEQEARRSVRRTQVKGTDRSEKIRTYNFPQGRLTDHRIPITTSGLEDAMDGGETLDMVSRELEIREEEEAIEAILAGEAP